MAITTTLGEGSLGRWLLCFDYFTLHPTNVFERTGKSLLPWLRLNHRWLLNTKDQRRSCYHLPATANPEPGFNYLCGVVDLCPCIKMTPGKKHRIQDKIRISGSDVLGRYWHICQHAYHDITLKIEFGFCSYLQDGELGMFIDYHYTCPSKSSSVCPRMLCPHLSLQTLISTLSECRELHSEQTVCARCKGLQRCNYCHSIVCRFRKDTLPASAATSYVVSVERRLTSKLWHEHSVFPFASARQRQRESKRSGAGWNLW